MSVRCAVLMDPIDSISIKKDSTFAMMLEAQARGWDVALFSQNDFHLKNETLFATCQFVTLYDDASHWFDVRAIQQEDMSTFDVVLMRKDPPFDMEYIYTTYLLEMLEARGVCVVNHPRSLRDFNEKLSTLWFPACCPETLVSQNQSVLRNFLEKQETVIYKPLSEMGGRSVFRVQFGDPNTNVILEDLTDMGTQFIMAQRFIPEIEKGDKRILLIDGEPIPYGLVRIPQGDEGRGNLAVGAKAIGAELTDRDKWICEQVGPTLKEKGLRFVGIDVIGDYLTEINVTSPTCIRELDALYDLNISAVLLDALGMS